MQHILNTYECPTSPVKLKNGNAVKFVVSELSFAEFTKSIATLVRHDDADAGVAAQRKFRRAKQIVAYDGGGHVLKIDGDELLNIPRRDYAGIMAGIDGVASPSGTVIQKGDGIDTPTIFKLATPLKTGGEDDTGIAELEFVAKYGRDIEAVLTKSTQIEQALALIETCATPIDSTLLRLPDWAREQITIGDGLAIMTKVLPAFLE